QSLIIRDGNAKVDDKLTEADLTFTFSTDEGNASKNPQSTVTVNGAFRARKLKSELTLNGFLPVASTTKNAAPIATTGWLTYGKVKMQFDGAIHDLFGEQMIKGKLAVTGPSLGDLGDLLSITLPRTTAFKIDSNIEKNPDKWIIDIPSA